MWEYDFYACSVPGDEEIARRLVESIRRYKLPRGSELPDDKMGYTNILLSTDPGRFDENAARQLDGCRVFLIICSPRTKHYAPITERLAYFERTRGKTNIIAVIVDGEPIDAFPESFIEQRIVEHILPDGTIEERTETIEPVASDLRGQNPKHTKRLLNYETVRIVASALSLVPDVLEQRHNKRARRRVTIAATTAGAVLLAAASIFTYFGLQTAAEGRIAELQANESLAVITRLTDELPEAFKDDVLALGYVYDTILDAAYALHENGSLSLSGVDLDTLLVAEKSDSPETVLKRATLARLTEHSSMSGLYEAAAEMLGLTTPEADVLLGAASHMQHLPFKNGMYVTDGTDELQRSDVILAQYTPSTSAIEISSMPTLEHDYTGVAKLLPWDKFVAELAPGSEITLLTLRSDGNGDFNMLEIKITSEKLESISGFVM